MSIVRKAGAAAALLSLSLLLSAPPRAGEPPADPAKEALPVPPGTSADQALWRDAGDVGREMTVVRTESSALQWKIHSLDLARRLESTAGSVTPEEATRLRALRERLLRVQAENHELLTGRWPVDPTRGCQYPQLMLGSAMQAGDAPSNRGLLGQARADARDCVDAARLILGRLGASNQALATAVDESVKALPGSKESPRAEPPAAPVPAPTGAKG